MGSQHELPFASSRAFNEATSRISSSFSGDTSLGTITHCTVSRERECHLPPNGFISREWSPMNQCAPFLMFFCLHSDSVDPGPQPSPSSHYWSLRLWRTVVSHSDNCAIIRNPLPPACLFINATCRLHGAKVGRGQRNGSEFLLHGCHLSIDREDGWARGYGLVQMHTWNETCLLEGLIWWDNSILF